MAPRFCSPEAGLWPSIALELMRLPGFIGVDLASTAGTSKHAALRSMEQADVDILPVVDGQRRFVGTVSRPALTASLILSITEQLEAR